jgi:hypothetical protein
LTRKYKSRGRFVDDSLADMSKSDEWRRGLHLLLIIIESVIIVIVNIDILIKSVWLGKLHFRKIQERICSIVDRQLILEIVRPGFGVFALVIASATV